MRPNKTRGTLTTLWILLILGVGGGRSVAQLSSASITGIVADPTDAAIPAAKVTINNKNTGEVRTFLCGQDGRYTFSLLIPGTYELIVEAPGFKTGVRSDVVLYAGQAAEADLKLELGAVVDRVDVAAGALALDTQSANQVTNLTQEQVKEIPLNFRNPLRLVYMIAGAKSVIQRIGDTPDVFMDRDHGLFAMNGGREGSNWISTDGLSAKAGDWGASFATPSVDAVQEVQVSRNTYDAEYGRVGNGVVNLVTKGGSNQWHGGVFEFIRNDKLDANRWEFNRSGLLKAPYRRNQFGANGSGPLWKSRHLYFLTGYEGVRGRETHGHVATLPSLLERQGDFTQSRNQDGSLQVIYDPWTTRPNPTGSGFIRDPFPGNRIPQDRFDPVGVGVIGRLIPKPNLAGDPITNANNFFGSGSDKRFVDRWDGRLDWARSEKHSMFFHLTRSYLDESAARVFRLGAEDPHGNPNGVDWGGPTYQMTLSNTFVPSPTWVINAVVGGGGSAFYNAGTSVKDKIDLTAIGYSTAFRDQFSARTVGGWYIGDYQDLGAADQSTTTLRTNSLAVHVSNERGAHSIKFGFSGEDMILNSNNQGTITMSFNRGPTTGPVATAASDVSGNTIAALLLGVGSGSAPGNFSPAASNKDLAWYAQDTWRATHRLTLTVGLRYELQRPRSERHNQQNYFDYNLVNPLGAQVGLPLRGGLVFSTPKDRGQTLQQWKNLAPRFGLVYKVSNRMVVRAGYGVSYGRSLSEPGVNGNDGFSTTTPWIVNPGGVVPRFLLSNPFPQGLNTARGAADGPLTFVGFSPTAWRRQNPTPYLQSYSLDVQYDLGHDSMFEIGYTGNVGRKFAYGVPVNYNQLAPQFLSMGQKLNDLVPNPFSGVITSGALSGPTVPLNQLLRPNPQFVAVNSALSEKGANSRFNALFLKFTHRFRGGLSLLTTYQWSKAMDNASEDQGWWFNDGRRDTYNASVEWSVSGHDVPHDFVNALVYELPVGRGKKFGSGMSGVPQAVLGGWEISGLIRIGSGFPVTLFAPNTLAAYGFAVQRPNITSLKDLQLAHRTPEEWWNVNAVQAPGTFEIGTAPRMLPNVRSQTVRNADMALMKNFSLWSDRMKVQFRAEAFNFTNTPTFLITPFGPEVQLGSGAFGTVTQTLGIGSRQVQFGLKINF